MPKSILLSLFHDTDVVLHYLTQNHGILNPERYHTDLLLPGTELSLITESFGLLNDLITQIR